MSYKTLNPRPNELLIADAAKRLGVPEQLLLEASDAGQRRWQSQQPTSVVRGNADVRVGVRLGDLNERIARFNRLQYGKLEVREDTLFNLHVAMQDRGDEQPFDFEQLGLSEDHVISFEDAARITGYSFNPNRKRGEITGRSLTTQAEVYVVSRAWVERAAAGDADRLNEALKARAERYEVYSGVPKATDYNDGLRERMATLMRRAGEKTKEEARAKYDAIRVQMNGSETRLL